MDYCRECRGIWLDRGELDEIIERSSQAHKLHILIVTGLISIRRMIATMIETMTSGNTMNMDAKGRSLYRTIRKNHFNEG